MALLHLLYRDAVFPRPAYRDAWERLLAAGDARVACRTMVGLLALAHDRGCEAELAAALAELLRGGSLPDLSALCRQFAPAVGVTVPDVVVVLPPVGTYDALLPQMAAATTTGAPLPAGATA